MTDIAPRYLALLTEAQHLHLPATDDMRMCFRVLSLADALSHETAALLGAHGLSEGRLVLLALLHAADPQGSGPGLAPHQLADGAGITRATTTGLLDALARDGLIHRQRDSTDRRSQRVTLTSQGRSLARLASVQYDRWAAALCAPLDDRDRRRLWRLLGKLGGHIAQAREQATASVRPGSVSDD